MINYIFELSNTTINICIEPIESEYPNCFGMRSVTMQPNSSVYCSNMKTVTHSLIVKYEHFYSKSDTVRLLGVTKM